MTTSPLDGFPVVIEVPVAWGEMDAYAHVNNTVYFRWFESARIAYFDRVAFRGGGDGGVGPILHSTHCRFRRPLDYPDRVRVGARVTEMGLDRFTMEYRAVSATHELIAADGSGIVVAFDYGAGQKATLPADVRAAIETLEGRRV